MKNSHVVIIVVVVAVIFAAGGFYGGMQYAASARKSAFGNFPGGAASGTAARRSGAANAGFINGNILSVDSGSLTIALRAGGSKIVLFSSSTEVGKFVSGVTSDLVVGQNVMVTGKANNDGSLTAQSIQVRPAGQTGPGGAPNGGPGAGQLKSVARRPAGRAERHSAGDRTNPVTNPRRKSPLHLQGIWWRLAHGIEPDGIGSFISMLSGQIRRKPDSRSPVAVDDAAAAGAK